MERRKLVKGALSTGSLAASALAFPQYLRASSRVYKFRLVMVVPKTLPLWGEGVLRFANDIREMTGGNLQIKVYGAGELVPALQCFDVVKSGAVDMAHSAAYYWQGKMPASPLFTSIPFGMTTSGMNAWLEYEGQQLWDKLYSPHEVFALPAGNTGTQMGGWFNRKINRVEDFKGLKMRIPGLGGRVLQSLGGKPTLVAGGEIYTNLATGVIDATEWVGPYHDYIMGFHKVAKYYYYPGWHEAGPTLELLINKRSWNKIPKEYQQIVRHAAASLNARMYHQWLGKDSEYIEKLRKEKSVLILPFPQEVLRALMTRSYEIRREVAGTSPLATEIFQSFERFSNKYTKYQMVSEGAYWDAIK